MRFKRPFLYVVILLATNWLTFNYADCVKVFFGVHNSVQKAQGHEIYTGVILPQEVLSGSECDEDLARSFLSTDMDWVFISKAEMPEFIKVKGTGFAFKGTVRKR